MPKVFLSYRHESDANHPAHQERVEELGRKLQDAKLDVILDRFYNKANPGGPNEGWPKWSEDRAADSDKVLIVASRGYFQCYEGSQPPGIGLGAACEANVIRNTLYQSAYKTEKHRIVYFDKNHITNIPKSLYQIVHFDTSSTFEINNLIAWLGGVPTTPTSANTALPPQINWPLALIGYIPDLANRGDEFDFFTKLLAGATSEQAVFFEAPSNHGKTILVSECITYAKLALKGNPCIIIDFKGNPSREDAIERIGLELKQLLPNYSNAGSHMRDLRSDLRVLTKPTLILFDTYEQASAEARDFVQSILLADIDKTPAIRIVIAGQMVPEHAKTLWAKSVRSFPLGPIRNPSHWTAFAQRKYSHVTPEQIKTLTDATGGQPGIIRMLIEGLGKNRVL